MNKVTEIRKGKVKNFEGGIEYYMRKREITGTEHSVEELHKEDIPVTRKDQKRIEAEQRHKRYNATKDLIRKIEVLERKISELEEIEKRLEKELTLPGTYSNPETARAKNLEFQNSKKELEKVLSEWEEASNELARIEQQFS